MSGSIGWFCTFVTLIGEGNTIQGVQINRTCNSYAYTKYACGRHREDTCWRSYCNSWSYSESPVGSISVSGAWVTGTTTLSSSVSTGGNQINGNWNYTYPAPAPQCPSGYSYNSSIGECETMTCRNYYTCSGSGRNRSCGYQTVCSWTGQITLAYYPPCMTGFYNAGNGYCYMNGGGVLTFNPVPTTQTTTTTQTASGTCISGTTLSGGQCISYTCPLGGSDTCIAPSGSSTYYCSPDSCSSYSSGSSYTLNNPNINANNPTNNGKTNSAGECLGQIYIFEGTALQCRNPGIQTVSSCCQGEKHSMFGMKKCNSQEQELAEQERAGECNMVGTYCAESFLGVCLQTKQVWCCFPGMLAEIIQYQARANQGIPAPNFGSPQSPNCEGFTPQQFQSINFSKINLDAFYSSIETNVSSSISNASTNAVGKLEQETP